MESAIMRLVKRMGGGAQAVPDGTVRGIVSRPYLEDEGGKEIQAPEIQADGFVLTDADVKYTGGLRPKLNETGKHVLLHRTNEGQTYYVTAILD